MVGADEGNCRAAIFLSGDKVPLSHRLFGIGLGFLIDAVNGRCTASVSVSLTTACSVILPDA